MPDSTYPHGLNTLVYKADAFGVGLAVTVVLYDPYLVEVAGSPFALTEIGNGLYKFDYTFSIPGIYHAVFLEGGVEELYHTYRVFRRSELKYHDQDRMVIA